jgi:hypothetical protein
MTAVSIRAWADGWRLVNAREIVELRATSPTRKLHQLAALMGSVEAMGWSEILAAEDSEVRERWSRLRKAYGQ